MKSDATYWRNLNTTEWESEIMDERLMLEKFGNISAKKITGFRGPYLYNGGDMSFRMLHEHLEYDCTLVHQRIRGEPPYFPYTLDFGYRERCVVEPCPWGNYPGLWVVPMNTLFKSRVIEEEEHQVPCSVANACVPAPTTANETFEYLRSNFDDFYETNRAPFPIFLQEAWLRDPERKKGYLDFVDWLIQNPDVHIVTISEVVHFMKNPRPMSSYRQRQCTTAEVPSTCKQPRTCFYQRTPAGFGRHMRSCARCPRNYPWLNNPLGH